VLICASDPLSEQLRHQEHVIESAIYSVISTAKCSNPTLSASSFIFRHILTCDAKRATVF
jgi:hypothetical protein